jgi:hypothetical protein
MMGFNEKDLRDFHVLCPGTQSGRSDQPSIIYSSGK